jgi:hypothetical protein
MSAEETPGQQVALDGSDPTRAVPVERGVVRHSRAIAQFALEFAAEAENGPAVQDLAKHINRCTEALERDDVPTEQVADFEERDHK